MGTWRQRAAPAEPATQLERVAIGLEPTAESERAARWVLEQFAPGADPLIVPLGGDDADPDEGRIDPAGAAGTVPANPPGDPIRHLVRRARAHGAGLIACPSPSWEGGLRESFWSTPESVARQGGVPVLAVRNPPTGPPRRLLLPIGPDGVSVAVARWVRELARRFGSEVVAARVVDLEAPIHPDHEAYRAGYLGGVRAKLEAQLQDAGLSGPWIEARVLVDHPPAAIVEAVESLASEMIVLGTRAPGIVERFLFASVTGPVIRRAACPVLLIPERGAAGATME